MQILEDSDTIIQLNEMFIKVENSLPSSIENSVYYSKLKFALLPEIVGFCKEQIDLKQDLNLLRLNIGASISESQIRDYLDAMKKNYNTENNNIALDYHIEQTRVDFGVPVFVVIKRDDAYLKKFVFRFRKGATDGLTGLSIGGVPIDNDLKEEFESYEQFNRYNKYKHLINPLNTLKDSKEK